MALSVRLAPRSALHRLPVPDALVRFLAEQGLDCATLRGTCTDSELGERLARLGLEPGEDLRIMEPAAPGSAAEDAWRLRPGAHLVTVSHRLLVRTGGPVAAVEAWLIERHGCPPAGEDGGALQRVCEPGERHSLELRAARLETLEQALTLEDLVRILSAGQVEHPDLALRARAGTPRSGFFEVESVLAMAHLAQEAP
ncbi:MAG: hypothetical protein ISQ08_06715 [Planctomycetes bacterium]|nr:hypothetical protein [Planctomycetota bacterium]